MNTINDNTSMQTYNFYKYEAFNRTKDILLTIKKRLVSQKYIHDRDMVIMSYQNIPTRVACSLNRVSANTDFLIIFPNIIYIIDLNFRAFHRVEGPITKEMNAPNIYGHFLYEDLSNPRKTKSYSMNLSNEPKNDDAQFPLEKAFYTDTLRNTKYKSIGLQQYLNLINVPCQKVLPITFCFHHVYSESKINNVETTEKAYKALLETSKIELLKLMKQGLQDNNNPTIHSDKRRLANIISHFNYYP